MKAALSLLLLVGSLRLAVPTVPEPEPRPIRLGMLVVVMDMIAGMIEEGK